MRERDRRRNGRKNCLLLRSNRSRPGSDDSLAEGLRYLNLIITNSAMRAGANSPKALSPACLFAAAIFRKIVANLSACLFSYSGCRRRYGATLLVANTCAFCSFNSLHMAWMSRYYPCICLFFCSNSSWLRLYFSTSYSISGIFKLCYLETRS